MDEPGEVEDDVGEAEGEDGGTGHLAGGVDQEMHGAVRGSRVPAGPAGLTEVPGIWVAGNVADISAPVMASAVQGLDAGAALNIDL